MVLVNIDKEYQFPTQLDEITLRHFIDLQNLLHEEKYNEAVMLISGITPDIYDKISLEGKLELTGLAQMLVNGEILMVGERLDLYEIMSCPIGQFEDWKAAIAEFKECEWKALPFLCLLETGEYNYDTRTNKRYLEYLNLPASVALFYQNKVNEQFADVHNKFLPLFESELEDIQLDAGVQSLNQFGGYGTLVQLADGIYKDIEAVSKTSVAEAYTFLTYKKIERTYLQNLEKLRREQINRNIQD